jgi:hypothetical protein
MEGIKRFMSKYPPSILIIILFFLTGLILIIYAILDFENTLEIMKEDSVVEYTQALLFLFGACLWGFAFFMTSKVKGSTLRLRLFYILFMGLFLFFFLEEISYGQRLFGFSTPESLEEANMQGETTVHNIGIDNSLTWIHILMALFIVTIGILFPLLKLGSKWSAGIFEKFQMPVVNQNLIACFCISLVFYSYPGFHWFIPIAVIALFIPVLIILSGKFSKFFDNFKYPLFQFTLVALMGILVIGINVNPNTSRHLTYNGGFEIRELLIAMALFFYSVYEAYEAWERKNTIRALDIKSQTTPRGIQI